MLVTCGRHPQFYATWSDIKNWERTMTPRWRSSGFGFGKASEDIRQHKSAGEGSRSGDFGRGCTPDRNPLALFKGFHRRRCDASRKRYAVKEAFADQVASDKGKLAPGVVSFIGPFFQRCRHPGAAFGPECPHSRKQLRRDCLY